MTEFAWNELCVGDRVVVNEHRAEAFGHPTLGTVAFVHPHPRHNDVGVRVDGDATARVRWPTRFELSATSST